MTRKILQKNDVSEMMNYIHSKPGRRFRIHELKRLFKINIPEITAAINADKNIMRVNSSIGTGIAYYQYIDPEKVLNKSCRLAVMEIRNQIKNKDTVYKYDQRMQLAIARTKELYDNEYKMIGIHSKLPETMAMGA